MRSSVIEASGGRKGLFGLMILALVWAFKIVWMIFVISAPFLGVWLSSTLGAYANGPMWVTSGCKSALAALGHGVVLCNGRRYHGWSSHGPRFDFGGALDSSRSRNCQPRTGPIQHLLHFAQASTLYEMMVIPGVYDVRYSCPDMRCDGHFTQTIQSWIELR